MNRSSSWAVRKSAWAGWLALVVPVALAVAVNVAPQTPAVQPANAPASEFSAERAFAHVQVIAQEPHPIGSPANAAVRDYLFDQLEALGLKAELQDTLAVRPSARQAAQVQNIIARLPGAGKGKAVLLVSHYDSTVHSPGASDDGSAVAAMLETARALRSGPALRNDVILLFADGEETGLMGAYAFQYQHPWAADVGLVLNFEARGVRGPSLMFETSPGNGLLAAEVAKAAPYPVTNSLMFEVYQQLPNDTDFTIFKEAGLPGLNFAFIEGAVFYHTALDRPANLSLGSLQHTGSYMLSLVRHFGGLDLQELKAPNAVYFDLFGRFLVNYLGAWAVPLLVLAILAWIGVVAWGLQRNIFRIREPILGLVGVLLSTALSAAGTWLLWTLVNRIAPASGNPYSGSTYSGGYFLVAVLSLSAFITISVYAAFRRWANGPGLAAGVLLVWLLLTAATSLLLPGASFVFVWPTLFGLAGLVLSLRLSRRPWLKAAVLTLAALPAVLLVSPLVYRFFVALGTDMIVAPVIVFGLLAGLFFPHLEMAFGTTGIKRPLSRQSTATRTGTAVLSTLPVLLSIAFLAGSLLKNGPDAGHPKMVRVIYGLDADRGQAFWIGFERPQGWTTELLDGSQGEIKEFIPTASGPFPKTSAWAVDLPAPEVQLLEDSTQGELRTLRLRVRSPRQAVYSAVYLEGGAEVHSAAIAGVEVEPGRELEFWALPAEGVEVSFVVKAGVPVEVRAVDRSFGFPNALGAPPRPDWLIPAPGISSNAVLVSKGYLFP